MSDPTTETMHELLDLVGITRVIWIDDKFDAPPVEQPDVSVDLVSQVTYLKSAGRLPDHELFASLKADSDQDVMLWLESEIKGDKDKSDEMVRLLSETPGAGEEDASAEMSEPPRAMVTSGSDEAGRDGASTSNLEFEEITVEEQEKRATDGPSPAVRVAAAGGHDLTESGSANTAGDAPQPPIAKQATVEASEGARSEYKVTDIDAIKKALGNRLETHGLKSWYMAKNGILETIEDGTLFLIDLEFKIDGVNLPEGKNIAGSVLSRANGRGIVIVLTHSTSAEGAPAFQAELARSLETEQQLDKAVGERLLVIPKQSDPSGGEVAVERLRRWLRVSVTLQTCFGFVDSMAKEMASAIDEARRAIRQQSVYHLDDAVFESSLREGALEFDVLSRILLARQRVAAEQFLGKDLSHVVALGRLRRLRQEVKVAPSPQASEQMLAAWYRDEVFVMGESINRANAPLVCGDMFDVDLGAGTKRRFVLLAQPCDISVRGKGTRKFEEAIFVEVIKNASTCKGSSATGDEPMMFKIPSFEGDGFEYICFRCWSSVSLRCLDFAVFNSDGRVRFDRAHSKDIENALLPGWTVRLKEAKAALVSAPPETPAVERDDVKGDAGSGVKGEAVKAAFWIPNEYRLLSLSKNVPASEGTVDANGNISFPYRRIGRLRAQRAVAAYAAFSSYQTRGAFEHDFSVMTEREKPKGTGGKPSEQGKPKGTEGKKPKDTDGKPSGSKGNAKSAVGSTKAVEEKSERTP